ncbi:hypothetical protein Gotur_009894 [Gossypium turneri]
MIVHSLEKSFRQTDVECDNALLVETILVTTYPYVTNSKLESSKMEGSKMAMVLVAYITVLVVFATGVAATSVREDQGAVAPSPMESAGVALGAPAVFVAVVSMLAWFF